MSKSWTDQQLVEAVRTSSGITEVVLKLYKGFAGSHFPTVWKHIGRLGLDTSHLNGRLGSTGMAKPVFQRGRVVGSTTLRKALKEVSEYRCVECGNLGTHNGKPLTLQVDHVDGDDSNNLRENLRWLCPNCHSQTPTYAKTKSKLIPQGRKDQEKIKLECAKCGGSFSKSKPHFESRTRRGQKDFFCSQFCTPSAKGIPTEVLQASYRELGSFLGVARRHGMSDIAVKKRLRDITAAVCRTLNPYDAGSNPAPAAAQETELDL